jgi:DnaJ-class molecular chaperone
MRRDYYVVLGIQPSESQRGIRDAFRDLALRYHPDYAGPAGAPVFREIVEAYRLLSDPVRRAAYDRGLRDAGEVVTSPPAPRVTPPATAAEPLVPERVEVLRGFGLSAPPIADVFGRFVDGLDRRWERAPSRQMEALPVEVALDPVQAAYGGWLPLAIPVYSPCPACRGAGGAAGGCAGCAGTGLALERRPMRVHLPPGVVDGARLQIPLRGLGVHNLYLDLRIRVGWA